MNVQFADICKLLINIIQIQTFLGLCSMFKMLDYMGFSSVLMGGR